MYLFNFIYQKCVPLAVINDHRGKDAAVHGPVTVITVQNVTNFSRIDIFSLQISLSDFIAADITHQCPKIFNRSSAAVIAAVDLHIF